MKKMMWLAMVSCLASLAMAEDYTETLTVNEGSTLSLSGANTAPQFINNGNLTIAQNGALTITSTDKVSDVATGVNATLRLEAGALLDVTAVTKAASAESMAFAVAGGTGTVYVAAGATIDANNTRIRFSRNPDSNRNLLSQSITQLDGTIKVTTAELAAYFRTDAEIVAETNNYPIASIINFSETGLLIVNSIAVNDAARAIWNMSGGTVQFVASQTQFVGNYGIMEINFAEGTSAIFDTQAHNLTITRGKRVLVQGAGGLTKKGTGTLDLSNAAAYSTFTGPIRVEAGTLFLGRPLAEGQTVYVCTGARYQMSVPEDDLQITYQNEAERPVIGGLYSISNVYLPGIDLMGYGSVFYTDRLGGPTFPMEATVEGAITHSDSIPFRLIAQNNNAAVTFTNTGLENHPIRLEGNGTFTFAGERTLDAESSALLTFDGGTYKQADYLNIYGTEGSHFLLENGTLTSARSVYIGRDGTNGVLTAQNANLRADDTIIIGGCTSGDHRHRTCGTLTATNSLIAPNNGIRFSPNNLIDGSTSGQLSNILTLQDGSNLQTPLIHANDDSYSLLVFDGGKVTMTKNQGTFISAGQANTIIDVVATNGHDIIFDTGKYTNVLAQASTAGNVRFLGDGNFIKRGTGLLEVGNNTIESRFYMTYSGNTVIEAGDVRLAGNDLFPFGEGTGIMTINSGATLNMNGKGLKVNDLTGNGTLINSSANMGRLDLGADNRNLILTRALPNNISIEKSGTGQMEVYSVLPPTLSIHGGTVTFPEQKYKFFRFKIERVAGSAANSVQFSELKLMSGSTDVTRPYVSASRSGTGNASPANEQPEKGVDGSLDTKFLDFNGATDTSGSDEKRNQCWLQLEYAEPIVVTAYTWATANDQDYGATTCRDPMNWRFQGSNDGMTWEDLDVQENYVSRTTRKVWIYDTFAIGAETEGGTCVAAANTTVFIGESATLKVMDGQRLKVAGISNSGGTVQVEEDATLIVSPAEGSFASISGGVSGSGSVQVDGAGTATMVGASDYSGDTRITSGTLVLAEIAENEDKWFRLSITQTYGKEIMQISEFGLFAADGTRQNLNLTATTYGTPATNLAPGTFCKAANYASGNNEDADKLFDDKTSTKWCATQVNMSNPADTNTWRVITMRLANAAKPIASYNFCSANDATPHRNPVSWKLESSSDGITWTTVADVVEDANTATSTYTWFNSGTPYAIKAQEQVGVSPLSPNTTVEVAAGALLSVEGANTAIGALRVDYANGGGTITRFNPAENGNLDITNVPAGISLHNFILPITLNEIVNGKHVASWTVSVNGVPNGTYRVITNGANQLMIVKSGMIMIFR
ncbi:MAG: autotransporter-associated beta strand repeat-containing protein [Kiritimatiellae bacterium]|nr:autotransporter-associated beta strand repeat-containing protein [Kiritimatiellia bacterium]